MTGPIRAATIADFTVGRDMTVRTQRFAVRRMDGEAGQMFAFSSNQEMFLLLPDAGATLLARSARAALPDHSVTIVQPGPAKLRFDRPAQAFAILLIEAGGSDHADALNAATYERDDPRIRPVLASAAQCSEGPPVRSFVIDEIPFPAGNPRIKFFQNSVMSINWVEYDGARDRTALSPHSHADFEQASLAIAGHYIHHSRAEWGANADLWIEDRHDPAGPGTMLIVPPEIIHTTEGVGEGRHILVDIFAPPRADFVARGLMHNADEYRQATPAGAAGA